MPSSRPDAIPAVISLVRWIRPESILDVGVGFGKWGHLFREYTDILASEREVDRYRKKGWKVRIDGIEGFPAYITPAHRYIYDHIYIGEALAILPTSDLYDLVFAGDILEHFDDDQGRSFLALLYDRAKRYVVLTTPAHETHQPVLCANELERHRSVWNKKKLLSVARGRVYRLPADILLVIYCKGEGPIPHPAPSFAPDLPIVDRVRQLPRRLANRLAAITQYVRP